MDIDPQFKDKGGSALRMWKDAAQNPYLSEQHGTPVFDEVILVEVISPGSRDSTPVFELVRNFDPRMNHPAPMYGMKYPEYKEFVDQFEKGELSDASRAGTPLKEWSEMTKSLAASLKARHIFTVEALAALPDTKLVEVGPDGRTWRTKAVAYLEAAKGSAGTTALAAELEREKQNSVELKRQLDEMAGTVAKLQAAAQANTGEAAPPADPLAIAPAIVPATAAPAAPPII